MTDDDRAHFELGRSVDRDDPPGRLPTADQVALPRLPEISSIDPSRSGLGHRGGTYSRWQPEQRSN